MAATRLSFRCEDCGARRKNVEEAQQHVELTAPTNFFQSTKETDLHTKKIGYAEFVNRTKEVAKPIKLEAAKKSEAEGGDGGEVVNVKTLYYLECSNPGGLEAI